MWDETAAGETLLEPFGFEVGYRIYCRGPVARCQTVSGCPMQFTSSLHRYLGSLDRALALLSQPARTSLDVFASSSASRPKDQSPAGRCHAGTLILLLLIMRRPSSISNAMPPQQRRWRSLVIKETEASLLLVQTLTESVAVPRVGPKIKGGHCAKRVRISRQFWCNTTL